MDEILLGDAYELIKAVPDKSIDLIVTDPPYSFGTGGLGTGIMKGRDMSGSSYSEIRGKRLDSSIDFQAMLPELVRVMRKPNIYVWCNKEQIYDYLTYFKGLGCNFEVLIWAKTNPPPFLGAHYLKDKEYCLYFWKGVKIHCTYERGKTVWVTEVNSSDKKRYHHPTIKPFGIISDLIENSSSPGGGSYWIRSQALARHAPLRRHWGGITWALR